MDKYTPSYAETICRGTERELREELELDFEVDANYFNHIIIDTTNSVGLVHVGLPFILELDSKDGTIIDFSEIHLPVWKTKEQLLNEIDQYENWSKLVIEQLGQ